MNTTKLFLIFMNILLCLVGTTFSSDTVYSMDADIEENQEESSTTGFMDSVMENLEYTLKLMPFVVFQEPADSTQNPDNDFYKIPSGFFETNLRLNASLSFDIIDFIIKPRYDGEWKFDRHDEDKDEYEEESYIHEYLVRLRLFDVLAVSYGRENLQWGPSYICSPSNVFFKENSRANPKEEIAGMEFLRLTFIPDISWSFSLIANTDKGRQEFINNDFEKAYAFKIDYTGEDSYISLIFSHKENDRNRLGGFGKLTVNDALLLYAEGSFSKGTNALYPKEDNNAIFNISMDSTKKEESEISSMLLIGGSYTFDTRQTLYIEYIDNSGYGYSKDQAEKYYQLRKMASDAYKAKGLLYDYSSLVLAQTSSTGLKLLRQHYGMIQYQQTNIWDLLDLTLRYTLNIDDSSYQFISIVELLLGESIELFFVGLVHSDESDTEFGSIIKNQTILGMAYNF